MNKKIAIGLVILVVVVIFGVMVLSKGKEYPSQGQPVLNNGSEVNDSSGVNNSAGTMLVGSNAISVNEQKIGSTAVVSFVVLEKQGYVVVHESAGGNPGKILGASALLPKGQSNNVSITLSLPLKEGVSYLAMPHLDNDDGVFDEVSDMPAKNNNDVVMMEFQASVDAQPQTSGEISL